LLPTETLRHYPEQPTTGQNVAINSAEVGAALANWWKELLNLDQVGLDDDFFDLGGHSLIGVQLFSAIKKKYGLNLGLSLLFDARTIRQLAEYIQQASQTNHSESKQSSVLVPLQQAGSRLPVFWIPGGYGTSVLIFKDISLLLGTDQPVYGFEVPMPEQDEAMESIEERAAHFIKEMRSLQPRGPYHLIGFCGGGYIAYEMAQQLSADGQRIGFLGIVDCIDPHYPHKWREKLRFNTERTVWRIGKVLKRGPVGIARWFIERSKTLGQALHSSTLRFKARLLGRPCPPAPETPETFMAKAWQNINRYYPTTYNGKCVVFKGKDTYAYAGLSSSTDPRLVWCKLSKGGSEVRVLPGDHLDMLKAPNMHEFAEQLKHFLQ
jgi:thioesterase domain-containing protein/acyl carrier protein